MISRDLLTKVISDQEIFPDQGLIIKRNLQIPSNQKRIVIITGVRRSGKSTLLRSSIGNSDKSLFLSFEDPRLEGFDMSDFMKVEEIAIQTQKKYLLFDEIQNVDQWEKYIRSANDRGIHTYITGSNASLLSRELGTRLTGRYTQLELYPFSYSEFLLFRNLHPGPESYREYLNTGGFPEYLTNHDNSYLRQLLKDIIIRDIAVRRNIRNKSTIVKLAVHLLSNIGKEFSYSNITRLLEISSVRSTIDYCDYLKESYLADLIPLYSRSIKKQIANPKKAYCIDTGLARANSLSFSEDKGRIFENAVFMHLRRDHDDIMYYKDAKSECDFLVRMNDKILLVIQACWHINEDNLQREILGISNAMRESNAKEGMIITFNQEDELQGIKVMPAWKWESLKQQKNN